MKWGRNGNESAKPSDYTTLIDEGSEIEGKFMFSGVVMLNGRLRGEIVSTDSLIVGEKAVVNATISAARVQIHGEVFGTVSASARLHLSRTARVHGDIDAPVIAIDEGALLEGHCSMGARSGEPPTPVRDYPVESLKR